MRDVGANAMRVSGLNRLLKIRIARDLKRHGLKPGRDRSKIETGFSR